jgi:hypothetical protein
MGARRLAVLVLAFVASCGPLYGGKPDKLRNPTKKKPPPEAEVVAAPIPWDDECSAKFQEKPRVGVPNKALASPLVATGDQTMSSSTKAPDPKAQAQLILEALSKYKAALDKDWYNAEATYGLAVAYAKLLKKGCALALLKRLASLEGNPKYANDARRMIDQALGDNAFKGFKKDAEAAMGK